MRATPRVSSHAHDEIIGWLAMTLKVRTQNPLNFTVQIRSSTDDAIVGSGVIISAAGDIATCAHVVRAAGLDPRDSKGNEISVYFPQLPAERKARKAIVTGFLAEHDDDAVLLRVTGKAMSLKPEQIAVLGTAEESFLHPFISYGFRPLGQLQSGYADGVILGIVDPPPELPLHLGPVQLRSSQINEGMSGCAVLDQERNIVVGIVSATWYPDASSKDRDTAWAVNTRVLTLKEFGLAVEGKSQEKADAPQPVTNLDAARQAVAGKPGVALHDAPPTLTEWVGRNELLKSLDKCWGRRKAHRGADWIWRRRKEQPGPPLGGSTPGRKRQQTGWGILVDFRQTAGR
jgi:hypothetical protein